MKPPKDRIQPESVGADESATSDLVSIQCDHFTDTSPGDPQNPTSDLVSIPCDDLTDTSPGDPQTEANVILEMQAKIATLESKLSICQEKLREADEEMEILLRRQFSIDKVKHDNSAIMFYTGFPSYEVLISFFHYIEPKICKMQYWKGEILLKESQSYQTDENRMKPGPSRKLNSIDEFFLVLMRLKAGLFVQDLSDRFGISITTVSRICITWVNFLYYELKDMFPFPSQELVRKNMPQEFAQFPTTRIILDCTELFIERPSAMLAQSETWSEYKHHNTWKLLVGVTPNGQVTFVSKLWGGVVFEIST